ncbi:MAG TPA: LL-diaminopimelate aminotransferase [bacterium]|nr:LL-diaminopimelate aminotransferase [bacterium]
MKLADRLGLIPPYLFMQLRQKINKAKAEGKDVISLGVGDPVEPTPREVVEELYRAAQDPENHHYPTDEEKGMLSFRKAVAAWYLRKYGVSVDPATEVLGLIGSKEGCHHFCLAVVNPGDYVLMTDPGYPAYRSSILFAGGIPYSMPMKAENNYFPKYEDIPSDILKKTKAMFLCYPNNPTGARATKEFFAKTVEFAKSYNIAVCHDFPYSEIVFDGFRSPSILSVDGAKDVCVELNSLSKPYNMTGWRIGMALGNKDLIAGISKVKENTDSGVFNAIQFAAIKALESCDKHIQENIKIYNHRRKLVVDMLNKHGWNYTPPKGTFYLWIPTPKNMSAIEFTNFLFDECNVVVAPGSAYGQYGEGYIRISVTVQEDRLIEAVNRIDKALTKLTK